MDGEWCVANGFLLKREMLVSRGGGGGSGGNEMGERLQYKAVGGMREGEMISLSESSLIELFPPIASHQRMNLINNILIKRNMERYIIGMKDIVCKMIQMI